MLALVDLRQMPISGGKVRGGLLNNENGGSRRNKVVVRDAAKEGGSVVLSGVSGTSVGVAGRVGSVREPSLRLAQRQARRATHGSGDVDDEPAAPRPDESKRKRNEGGRDADGSETPAKRAHCAKEGARSFSAGQAGGIARQGAVPHGGSADSEKDHDKYCHFCQVCHCPAPSPSRLSPPLSSSRPPSKPSPTFSPPSPAPLLPCPRYAPHCRSHARATALTSFRCCAAQHAKKSMLPCESEGCTHIYCLYCLSVHLGDDTDPATSSAWLKGSWRCPTCRQG